MNNPITTSDGELLSVKLKKVESFRRRTALLLVAPLLLFIIFTYIMPIGSLMWRSIDNTLLSSLLSNTNEVIQEWNGMDGSIFLVRASTVRNCRLKVEIQHAFHYYWPVLVVHTPQAGLAWENISWLKNKRGRWTWAVQQCKTGEAG